MTQRGLTFRFLSEEDLIGAGVLDMDRCVETMEEVFSLVARGDYLMGGPSQNDHGLMMWFPQSPPFPGMPAAGPDRRFMSMMAYLGGDFHVIGEKWYGSNVANRHRGLPRSIHTITLNDVDTGAPIAYMSGNLISAMRTGAVAGVAARHLANADAQKVAIIGAGVISRACARAIACAMPGLKEVKVFDLDLERARAFAAELTDEFGALNARAAESMQGAIAGSDVISVATSGATSPEILGEWVKPGAVLALTGNTSISAEFYQQSRLVVDNWAMHEALYHDALAHRDGLESIRSWAMSADLLELLDGGHVSQDQIENLGSFVAGKSENRADRRATIFISGGMPVEDVAWAKRVYAAATERDLGQLLQLWDTPHWA